MEGGRGWERSRRTGGQGDREPRRPAEYDERERGRVEHVAGDCAEPGVSAMRGEARKAGRLTCVS